MPDPNPPLELLLVTMLVLSTSVAMLMKMIKRE
jgi:hypothetical protein